MTKEEYREYADSKPKQIKESRCFHCKKRISNVLETACWIGFNSISPGIIDFHRECFAIVAGEEYMVTDD
ncbi:MAG: hypothetical protein Q7R33_09490 [Nitrosarchaeum sp.]|nr:hypothetical protein [Nitrosarchaeum sp.]